jgi:hypothetical protein
MIMDIDTLIRTNFLAFAMKAFNKLYQGEKLVAHNYVRLLASHLEQVAEGKSKRLVVTLPPRHLKTFLGSICLTAWILGKRPSAQILILSYGQEHADNIAHSIRGILKSGWYRQFFKTRIAKSKLNDFHTTDGGRVRSISVDGGVTGQGADFIIIDDPVEIKDYDNVKQLARINDRFDSLFRTRLNHPNKGAILIIAHRLAEDDLPGHVL